MRKKQLPVVGALVALLACSGVGVGAADDAPDSGQELAPVMVVLDASGSMAAAGNSGGTRMDEAKDAMRKLIDDAPDNSRLGLSVYGTGTGSSDAEKAAGCKDVKTVQPVDTVDKSSMRDKVDGLEPRGYTPIGKSLRHASEELPDTGKRSVVLVSDGQDTCAPPPPCEVAKDLSKEGTDLTVHTVGFRVGGKARSQLQCIAEDTGGTYSEARDSDSLERTLPRVNHRAQRSYKAQGTLVDGSQGVRHAPHLEPGQYVDRMPADRKRHYELTVPQGMTARIAATQVWPAEDRLKAGKDAETLQMKLTAGGDPVSCVSNNEGTANSWDGPVTNHVNWTNDEDSDCTPGKDGRVTLSVNRDTKRSSPPEHELELLVLFEPSAKSTTKLPSGTDPTERVGYEPPTSRSSKTVRGGGSFNSAAKLPGAGRYSDSIKNGEWVAYRVWLDWGQALTYEVGYDDRAGGHATDSTGIKTEVYGPDRASFGNDGWESTATQGRRDAVDPISTTPVAYDNRSSSGLDSLNDGAYLAGWHYITVRADHTRNKAHEMQLDLTVNVLGDKVDPPNYTEIGRYPDKPIAEGRGSATGHQQPASDTRHETSDSSTPRWPWLAGGAAAIGVAGLVTTLVVIRRRNTTTPHNHSSPN